MTEPMWLLFVSMASAVDPLLPLELAWEQAIRANPEIRQAEIAREIATHQVGEARGAFDPVLDLAWGTSRSDPDDSESSSNGWSAGLDQNLLTGGSLDFTWTESQGSETAGTRTWTDSMVLSLDQPLLDGMGPLSARAELRRALREARKGDLDYRLSLEQLLLDVSQAWWRAVQARESLELARRSLEMARKQQAGTEERRDEGFAALGDVLQVQRQVGVAGLTVVNAEAEAEGARLDLCRMIGTSLTDCPIFSFPEPPAPSEAEIQVEAALAVAHEHNLELQRLGLEVEQGIDDLRQARNQVLPSLDLNASLGWMGLATASDQARSELLALETPSWGLGADISVPLPGRAPLNQLAIARLTADQLQIRLEAAQEDLERSVREAVRDVNRDRARVALARSTVDAAEQALTLDQEQYREGRCTSRDVVLSLEARDEAQATRLAAQVDLQASLLNLERVKGTLLERVGR